MAAASAAGGGAYIGATPMAIATQIPPSALNGIGSPVVPSAQGKTFFFFLTAFITEPSRAEPSNLARCNASTIKAQEMFYSILFDVYDILL